MIRRPSAFHLNGSVFSIAPKERQTSKLTFESTNTWTGQRPYKCSESGSEERQGFASSGDFLRHQKRIT
ncbi:hypothetical protein N7509_006538 [Penicillium cosmopolitanum]|uniref:Uncharacterized protein n=1 Tax=Penicillium cosmopolitanum TaxID=1131564 RepID=A0A9W9W0G3_9EURO|nr:uncharacterized protein N7509_006538 [Penicillium cosmopolitanum]KAJ5394751.1 hypothetical protein N7509_006538 [Penicillium cosmopolitanum]